ncbi:DUF4249 domain-containing protein [Larkinella sp. VNQ87]|uniref:DUF4249 domain-containing protein n=1 Tax=Larkinella sp. VNQ87 TaxID=3400921 RepID=UPI003C048F5B
MKKPGWLLILLALAACQPLQQEVVPQQLTSEPVKLVVACFIAPEDTVIAAKVARSRPLLDDETVTNLDITNATVTLQSRTQSVVLRYDARLRYYRVSPDEFPIIPGETYQLTVQMPDGQRVDAETTVPAPVDLHRVRLDSEVVLENDVLRKRLFARYFWTDPPGVPNYYETEGVFSYPCPNCNPAKTVREPVQFLSGSGERAFYTDQDRNGKPLTSGNGYLGASIPASDFLFSTVFQKPLVLTASLLHLNADYYRYHEALQRQQQADGNPFAEPVTIPSNIRGGLGCFGAYHRRSYELRVMN